MKNKTTSVKLGSCLVGQNGKAHYIQGMSHPLEFFRYLPDNVKSRLNKEKLSNIEVIDEHLKLNRTIVIKALCGNFNSYIIYMPKVEEITSEMLETTLDLLEIFKASMEENDLFALDIPNKVFHSNDIDESIENLRNLYEAKNMVAEFNEELVLEYSMAC